LRTDTYERDPSVRDALQVPARFRPVPLFASLAPEDVLLVEALAVERDADAGETLVQQWDSARDFFVIADGAADVLVDGETVTRLGPGDFFGELAALDWGAGYGYPRLASVVATSPSRLLVFPDGSLNELLRAVPALEPPIRDAVRERLARHS
jgi:CRP-like cAMP-binding protein